MEATKLNKNSNAPMEDICLALCLWVQIVLRSRDIQLNQHKI